MHLKICRYPVKSIVWGEATQYNSGELSINREELLAHLQKHGLLNELEITDMALVVPGTATRVVNIFDVFAARARLGKSAVDYPGVLGPLQSVGDGVTAALDNFSVLAISSRSSKYNKVLDMSGPGSVLTPHSGFFHLALRAEPKRPDMTRGEYYGGVKRIGLCAGSFLARFAAAASPADTLNYTLNPRPLGLPRAAYICMLNSHQRSEAGEPVLYGDDVSGLLPTILHPNEFLDGAVIAPYWNMGIDTYSFQNNPVIMGLYDRHGKDLDFAGVVVCVAHITRVQRERSVQMIANLVQGVLGADLAVITKVGGGIPESDLMMTVESLEQRGIRTAAMFSSRMGDGTIKDSLTAYSAAADAIGSVGVSDAWVDLPEQVKVVGGSTVGPFTDEPDDKPKPANTAIRVRYRDISGTINQLGASRVAMVEI